MRLTQFYWLGPSFTQTEVIYWVNHTDDEIPDLDYIEEFAGWHFTNLNFKEIFFDPQKYIAEWAFENKNTMYISGSFKRSKLSAYFKKSFIEDVIKVPSAIIFIAHN